MANRTCDILRFQSQQNLRNQQSESFSSRFRFREIFKFRKTVILVVNF